MRLIVPIDSLGNELIWFGIEPHFCRIGDGEAATADFTEGFTGGTGHGGVEIMLGHRLFL
ncbi:hypothetical protein [Planctomicrobium sp. SH527]|uniref:hypothetical protein n=1 Tax=Planctomicrobium sp. SH527 TaxID=3448123 RepID=UPI003F5BD45B